MVSLLTAETAYQNIEIKADPLHRDEIILYLDNAWQLSSFHEYKYHESIATIPMAAAPAIENVLICGGGDGMTLRDVLAYPINKAILAEIDGGMIKIFRDMPEFAKYNRNSMKDPRAEVIVGDALQLSSKNAEKLDMIILDFPSPTNSNTSKNYKRLFSRQTMKMFVDKLAPHGVISMQASIGYQNFAPLAEYLLELGFIVWQYDAYYGGGMGHDAFAVASRSYLRQERDLPTGARFATRNHVAVAFSKVTEINRDHLEYTQLFCYDNEIEADDADTV